MVKVKSRPRSKWYGADWPNWKDGKGGASSWSQRFLPLRRAATMVRPTMARSKAARPAAATTTLASSATAQRAMRLPTQCACSARRAASTSGSSGIAARLTSLAPFLSLARRQVSGDWWEPPFRVSSPLPVQCEPMYVCVPRSTAHVYVRSYI